jgi:putative hydroxymethylpyrimidine transport system substrate-binding protein
MSRPSMNKGGNVRALSLNKLLRLTLLIALGVIALIAGAAAGARPAAVKATPTLKVALDWFPNPDHVALYYALDKGYFSTAGVNVSPKTPSDPSAGLKLVATNKFDLAIYYEGDLFFAGQQGLPVMAVGALVPTPLNSMIAKNGSKIKTLTDIKGATVGSAGLPFDAAVVQTIEQRQHLSSGDIKSVNVGFNLVPALLTGKADAIVGGYWNIEAVEVANQTGKKPVVFTMGQLGVPNYDELIIVANRDRLKSDAAYATAVRHFLAGLAQGITGSRKDQSGSIAIMKKDSSYKMKDLTAMVPLTLQALGQTRGTKVTCFSGTQWQTFANWMFKTKLLKKAIAPSTIETNAYNPNC